MTLVQFIDNDSTSLDEAVGRSSIILSCCHDLNFNQSTRRLGKAFACTNMHLHLSDMIPVLFLSLSLFYIVTANWLTINIKINLTRMIYSYCSNCWNLIFLLVFSLVDERWSLVSFLSLKNLSFFSLIFKLFQTCNDLYVVYLVY